MNQLELHKKIDALLLKNPGGAKRDDVSVLISANKDAHQYFFVKADEQWLDWLWENSFLDVIKQKAEDPTRYGYRTPEVNYLVKVAEKEPARVVDIMLQVPISKENFNPEVVDRFMRICSTLPAAELKRMVNKIRRGGWVPLMGAFNDWGFEYEKMLKTLSDAKDYESILTLAEAILLVRPEEEVKKEGYAGISTEKPFYFSDLSYTKVFEHLVAVDDEHAEQALALTTKILSQVILLGGKAEDGEVFPIQETFHLFDVDFFTLELNQKAHLSSRDDVRELAAVVKTLAKRTIGSYDTDPWRAKELYKRYFAPLSDSRAMWRLHLYVLSIYPEYFKEELKAAFLRLFEVERYHEIISGAEYERALGAGFHTLSEEDKRRYVKQVIEYFKKHAEDKEDQKWHRSYGSRILSMIIEHLTEDEKQLIDREGFKLNPSYKPTPSIVSSGFAGSIRPRGTLSQEEFGKLPVLEIVGKLKNEWTSENLRKQNKDEDFHTPLNAEGVGEQLRVDIAKRLQVYIDNASLFFERDVLNQHYTYSFMRGVQEAIKNDKEAAQKINWDNLIAVCNTIKDSGLQKPFDKRKLERDRFDAWLADWTAVHSGMTDVAQVLIDEDKTVIDFLKYRDQLFEIISYLFAYPDPTPQDEEPDTAKMKSNAPGRSDYLVSDPFSMAINTVRGRAYQALVLFVYQDGKKFKKEDEIKISKDVKKLYEDVLGREDTRALMFMFGHYLPSFYFRDIDWAKGLLPKIFPEEEDKKHLYIAAWEGYLSTNLYKEMFEDPNIQELYKRGLELTDVDDPRRKHFKDPDEGLAIHLALAFMHYKDFNFEHPLFKAFWEKKDPEQYADFISFLGRMFVSGSNASADGLLKKDPLAKKNLKELWDYLLRNCADPKPFIRMGFWISLEKDIFEPIWLAKHIKRTLRKTKGVLDWDRGLAKTVSKLAEEAPKDTLEIARLYLLEGGVRGDMQRRPLYLDNEWAEALKILYENKETKSGTYTLIDELIREGGSTFWSLKEMMDNKT